MITKPFLQALINDYKGEDLAGHICGAIENIDRVKADLAVVEKRLAAEHARHLDAIAALTMEREAVRDGCRHLSFRRHQHPACNNSSFSSCDVCGKEW